MNVAFRFSSGDLSSECDDVDPNDPTGTGRAAPLPPPLQQQPMPNSSGGPPNIPPPPAPTRGSFHLYSFCPRHNQKNIMMKILIIFIIHDDDINYFSSKWKCSGFIVNLW